MMKVKDIITILNKAFPEDIASKNDPVGLQLGSINNTVSKIMTTLDVRPEVVDEAVKNKVDLIISHHPLMFFPAKNLDFANPQNAMYAKLIANGITVYSIHTNSDKALHGSSEWQAHQLELHDIQPFCLDDDSIAIGRKGKLPEPMTADKFAYYVKQKMNIKMVRLITANNEKLINSVAFICGDGGKYWRQALIEGVDAFITSDIYYHVGHDIISSGLTVVDPGHYTEELFKYKIAEQLKTWLANADSSISIMVSKTNTNPFQDLF